MSAHKRYCRCGHILRPLHDTGPCILPAHPGVRRQPEPCEERCQSFRESALSQLERKGIVSFSDYEGYGIDPDALDAWLDEQLVEARDGGA